MKIVSDKAPKVDVASILTAAEIAAIDEFVQHYPHARAASLDALKIVQKRNGWVDDAQVNAIANILDIQLLISTGSQLSLTVFTANLSAAM